MTPYELRRQYRAMRPEGHFFTKPNMQFAGDSMRNFGVRDAGTHWELYRKSPVMMGGVDAFYFDKKTMTITTVRPEEK